MKDNKLRILGEHINNFYNMYKNQFKDNAGNEAALRDALLKAY
jgi:hypothetical protein